MQWTRNQFCGLDLVLKCNQGFFVFCVKRGGRYYTEFRADLSYRDQRKKLDWFNVQCTKETRYRRRLEKDLYNSNDTVIFTSRYVIHRPFNRRYLIDTVKLLWSLSRPIINGVINSPKNIVSNDRRPCLKLQITSRQDNWSMRATGCSCAIMIAGYPWPVEKTKLV